MFLLRYFLFQITEVTFVMHYPSRNIYLYNMRERAKRASAQNHRVFSYITHDMAL